MAKILVTGMSGTGKSSALAELGRRGCRVVETDDPGWSEWVESPNKVFGGEWLWVEDRMAELLQSDDDRTLFVEAATGTKGSSMTGSTPSYCSVHQPMSSSTESLEGRRTTGASSLPNKN
jgi:hypothetical protein